MGAIKSAEVKVSDFEHFRFSYRTAAGEFIQVDKLTHDELLKAYSAMRSLPESVRAVHWVIAGRPVGKRNCTMITDAALDVILPGC